LKSRGINTRRGRGLKEREAVVPPECKIEKQNDNLTGYGSQSNRIKALHYIIGEGYLGFITLYRDEINNNKLVEIV